jgi:hypothetical protein
VPTPVFATAYQVVVSGFLFGQDVENVWYVQGPDPFDAAVAADIAATFQTGYVGIMNNLSQDLSVNEIHVQNLNGTASGEFTLAVTPTQTGGLVQDSEPGNVAFCISLRTALAGRRTRGRKYFSGIAVGDRSGNSITSIRADALLVGVSDLIADLVANSTPICIFSPTGLTLVPVTAAVISDLFLDSQRRRLTGRGN